MRLKIFLYVEDFVIFRSKFIHIAARKLQLLLNKLTPNELIVMAFDHTSTINYFFYLISNT